MEESFRGIKTAIQAKDTFQNVTILSPSETLHGIKPLDVCCVTKNLLAFYVDRVFKDHQELNPQIMRKISSLANSFLYMQKTLQQCKLCHCRQEATNATRIIHDNYDQQAKDEIIDIRILRKTQFLQGTKDPFPPLSYFSGLPLTYHSANNGEYSSGESSQFGDMKMGSSMYVAALPCLSLMLLLWSPGLWVWGQEFQFGPCQVDGIVLQKLWQAFWAMKDIVETESCHLLHALLRFYVNTVFKNYHDKAVEFGILKSFSTLANNFFVIVSKLQASLDREAAVTKAFGEMDILLRWMEKFNQL
ncbi:hypothetical protein MJT46_010536 [Ovis ammon polii x Ovis aries]|nr:hypothetical protein MJT46_010536 [Ovis ammon polii x Ovis aries]